MRALVIVACFFSSTALADRVSGSPPTDCPTGSYPSVDHGGPHCAIVRCTSDTECTEWSPDLRCGPEASLCVVTDEFNTYARRPNQRERAAAACVEGACSEGTCETRRFCVRGAPEPEPEPETQPEPEPETQPETQPATQPQTQAPSQQSETEESGCSAAGAGFGPAWILLVFFRRRRWR